MKKSAVFLMANLILTFPALADIPAPADLKKKQQQDWEKLGCKDSKNLISCEYAVPSPDPADCMQYRNQPEKFKFLGRDGTASFGKEKYCRRQGKDL